jgi:hypothetical protein
MRAVKTILLSVVVVTGCGGSSKPDNERYAVGTYVFIGANGG